MSFRYCMVLATVGLAVWLGLLRAPTPPEPARAVQPCLLPNADWLNYGLDASPSESELRLIALASERYQLAVGTTTMAVGFSLDQCLARSQPLESDPLLEAVLLAADRESGLDLVRRSCSPVVLPGSAVDDQPHLVVSRVGFEGKRACLVCCRVSERGSVQWASLLRFVHDGAEWRIEDEVDLLVS